MGPRSKRKSHYGIGRIPLFEFLLRLRRFSSVEGSHVSIGDSDKIERMSFPIKMCVVCGEEFELRPDKPGFANRCPECSTSDAEPESGKRRISAEERKTEAEANTERRKAIRDLLYRKDR